MKGKSSQDTVSARMRRDSRAPGAGFEPWSRAEDSCSVGRINSSEMMVSRKMQPKTAVIFAKRFFQSMLSKRGYSIS